MVSYSLCCQHSKCNTLTFVSGEIYIDRYVCGWGFILMCLLIGI